VYLALALAFGSLVSYAVRRQNRFLASRPLRQMGRISYGIYIWHPIVFSIYWATPLYRVPAHFGMTRGIGHMLMQCALTIPFAALSWKYIEKPILQLKRHFENKVPAAAGIIPPLQPELAGEGEPDLHLLVPNYER
jgi:peptidoglycan/LPS O-acetylase OafA/YrhL